MLFISSTTTTKPESHQHLSHVFSLESHVLDTVKSQVLTFKPSITGLGSMTLAGDVSAGNHLKPDFYVSLMHFCSSPICISPFHKTLQGKCPIAILGSIVPSLVRWKSIGNYVSRTSFLPRLHQHVFQYRHLTLCQFLTCSGGTQNTKTKCILCLISSNPISPSQDK